MKLVFLSSIILYCVTSSIAIKIPPDIDDKLEEIYEKFCSHYTNDTWLNNYVACSMKMNFDMLAAVQACSLACEDFENINTVKDYSKYACDNHTSQKVKHLVSCVLYFQEEQKKSKDGFTDKYKSFEDCMKGN